MTFWILIIFSIQYFLQGYGTELEKINYMTICEEVHFSIFALQSAMAET